MGRLLLGRQPGRGGHLSPPATAGGARRRSDHVLGLIKPALVIGDPKRLAKITAGGAWTRPSTWSEIRTIVDARLGPAARQRRRS